MTETLTRRELIQTARAEIGTNEVGFTNDVKYGRWYGMNKQPWCDMFVSWVLHKAGNPDGYKSAYTPGGAAFWKAKGRWVEPADLERGDIAYFDFPDDGVNRISHVGIVEKVLSNGTVVTIEGNTSPGSGGSQRDGGGVYRRVRPLSYIVGGGRPSFTGAGGQLPLPVLKAGSKGPTVRELQKDLALLGYDVQPTGSFGPPTAEAVRKFQRRHELDVDGQVGRLTWAALERVLSKRQPQETTKKPGTVNPDVEARIRDSERRLARRQMLRMVRKTRAEIDRLEGLIDQALDDLEDELKGAA